MDIPEKFKNENGELNVDSLMNSYLALEKKMGGMISIPNNDMDDECRQKFFKAIGVPDDVSEYPIHPMFENNDSIRNTFKKIGLNKNQVEQIYLLADEILKPELDNIFQIRSELEELSELEKIFGSKDKMISSCESIQAWGEKFLPEDVMNTMCSSAKGIQALYNMMQSVEPKISTGENFDSSLNENDLRTMMRDPKYWREHDQEYVKKIESGFKKLYS